MLVELGNARPMDEINGVPTPIWHGQPAVTYVNIADYDDPYGNRLYTFPDVEVHDDRLFPDQISRQLIGVNDEHSQIVRRAVIDRFLAATTDGAGGLPDHEAFVAVAGPLGVWNRHSTPGLDPTYVWSDHLGMQHLLALYFGCPEGRPEDVEDLYWTRHGQGTFRPGSRPAPGDDLTALHTSWGRDHQAIAQGGAAPAALIGQTGVLTASSATSATFATGTSHASNDMAGQVLFVGPNTSGAGSTVYGLAVSNTSGTTPVATVDQWYTAAAPGGAAATTPNATGSYLLMIGGMPSIFVALSTDTTAKSLGGTGGTADAASITQTLTSEITTASGGLIRKIGVMAHTAGAATWTNTPVFTANGSDSLPVTVGTAALSPSMKSGTGALEYMTLVSPTATLSSSGDQLTLTWTFTMT